MKCVEQYPCVEDGNDNLPQNPTKTLTASMHNLILNCYKYERINSTGCYTF